MLAIQAPPTLWACTMSTRSEAIRRFKSACATPEPERIDRGIHERNPFAAEGREFGTRAGPPRRPRARGRRIAAARRRRSSAVRADGLLAQSRHDLQDRRAGQGARRSLRVVAFVAHGAYFLGRHRPVCRRRACIQWRHAAKTRHGPPAMRCAPNANPDPANERSLPEILECWNRYCGPRHRRAARARERPRACSGSGGFKSDMKGTKARGARPVGAGPWPRDDALRLFRPRRVRRQFHRRHHRPLA